MNPVSPSSSAGSATPSEAYANRVIHAARQFEAVLLNTLLGSLEHSFSALPGKKPDSIADNYHSMGMQALAATLADRGGVGIANMIVRNLLHRKGQAPSGPAGGTKVSSPNADKQG
jgi:Rod binding domain-containing protein